jgi:NapC/NirT cytochrome c family, N-terminal region
MRLRGLLLTHPAAILAAALIALSVAGAAAVPVFKATEKPTFCISCHEMQPYYDAWEVGAHKDVDCVACHVDPGTLDHLEHKAVATKELVDHFTTKPAFPRGDAVVPDVRCLVCHKDILNSTGPKFSHKQHAGTAPCVRCHRDTGHQVSLEALKKAGVLAKSSSVASGTGPAASLRSASASGSVVATSAAHVAIPQCTKCHDLDKQKCDTCHKAPAYHFPGDCATCHKAPGVSFKTVSYDHADPTCTSCHTAPAKHRAGQCSTCHHNTGTDWKFTHPTSIQCSNCHAAPGGHYGPSCSGCHKVGVPFKNAKVAHNLSLNCAGCHTPPGGHHAGRCSTCHRSPGASWAFTHPASTSCASCHGAPANHYGNTCSSCHSPSRAWASATFTHPSVNHGWKAWACVKCHPNGYASHSCTTCHGPNGGGD